MNVLPPQLKPGDTIGIAAPASPFDRERFDKGVRVLEEMGYPTFIPEGVFEREGYLAGPDGRRAESLNRLFANPGIHAVICARGGYGSLRMLQFLDFQAISGHPKMLVGFSDATALLSALISHCRIAAFHGPTVTTLADAGPETVQSLSAALGKGPPGAIAPGNGRVLRPGKAGGPVAGGNLTTLCHLLATAFAPDFGGCILLLEERGEAPYRIDRMLTQMRLAGILDGVAGVLLGSFIDCGDAEEIDRIVTEVFAHLDIPILAGFDIGHGRTNVTVPLGVPAYLDTERRILQFQRP